MILHKAPYRECAMKPPKPYFESRSRFLISACIGMVAFWTDTLRKHPATSAYLRGVGAVIVTPLRFADRRDRLQALRIDTGPRKGA
jgi:hypothetical protein